MKSRVTIFLLVSILGAIGATELLLRIIHSKTTTTSDAHCFLNERWNKSVKNNDTGFRERNFDPQQTVAGTPRMIIVGDNVSYGRGLASEFRYSAILNKELKGKVEVLNLAFDESEGIPTIDKVQEILETIKADKIIFQLSAKRLRPNGGYLTTSCTDLTTNYPVLERMCKKSILLDLAIIKFKDWEKGNGKCETQRMRYSKLQQSPELFDFATPMYLLDDYARLFESKDLQYVFILFPELSLLGESYPLIRTHQAFKDHCSLRNYTCLDYFKSMSEKQNTDLMLNQYDSAPNAEANRLIAKRLLKFLPHFFTSDVHAEKDKDN